MRCRGGTCDPSSALLQIRAGTNSASRQRMQDEVGARGDADLRQHDDFVVERWIDDEQSMIFGNCLIQTMTALGVGHINLRPRWCQEYAAMTAIGAPHRVERRLTGQVLKGSRGIDQTPVKEHPSCRMIGGGSAIGNGELDGASRKGGSVHPWEGRAVARQLLPDDPAAWLFDGGVTTPAELRQQR